MLKIKGVIRTGILYITSVVLLSAPPMAAFAADDETYYYDEANGRWNTSKWTYDPASNTYKPSIAASSPPPTPAPTPSTDTASDGKSSGTSGGSVDSSAAEVNNTGPTSNNEIDSDTDINSDTNINNKTDITNNHDSTAKTGDAKVNSNTSGGNASSGTASADTTVINSVHSTVGNGETSGVARFTIDLYGDIEGDIVVGPTMGNAKVDESTQIKSNTNVNNDSSITNNIDLAAQSGNAEVSSNSVAGSAQSGDARAVANLMNLVNTVIGANKSFVGTINIHGNLNGDILISPEFIPQLLASNATEVSTYDMPLSTNINDDQQIVNNVNLEAVSGTATVKDNTSAGNATSGTAQTDLQILNLTGHEVDAENSVLVFVNVKGKWVGVILDAPGATAGAYGTNVTRHTQLASNTNLNNKAAITNNINVSAITGDATVEGNTQAGDAKTGNASASANIANISNSKFNLTGWFAVLFINIDGDWTGYALKDTEAGNKIAAVQQIASSAPPPPSQVGAPNVSLGFKPKNMASTPIAQTFENTTNPGGSDPEYAAAVLASAKKPTDATPVAQPVLTQKMSPREDPFSTIMMIGGFSLASLAGIAWIFRRWFI